MREKLAALSSCSLILVFLSAQPVAWGQTAVTCLDGTSGANWSAPTTWGLEPPCYPDAGICAEDTWNVTVQPACFVAVDVNPSITTLFLSGGLQGGFSSQITVTGTTTLFQSAWVANVVFQNDGDLHRSGVGTASTVLAEFNSPGTIEVNSGTLTLSGGGVASGRVEVDAGAELLLTAPYDFSGDVVGSGVVRIDAHLDQINSTGTWTAGLDLQEGEIHFAAIGTPESVAMSYGKLTGNVTIQGPLNWTGGTMAAPGTTWIAATADVTDDFLDPKLDGRQLVIGPGATLNVWRLPASVAGNGIWGVNGASVLNRGTVHVVDGVPFYAASPTDALFENEGLFEKSTLNTATVQFEFINHGIVHVKEGFLEFVDDYVQWEKSSTLMTPVTQLGGGTIGDTGALVDIQEGYLQGSGTIASAVQCTGVISPGVESTADLVFGSTLTMGPGSALEFELAGLLGGEEGEGGEHDRIIVFDDLVLDGDLLVTFAGGFENGVQPGDAFDLASVLSVNAIQGQLAGQPSGSQILTADGFGSFTVEYGPGATFPQLLRLTNYQPATPNPAGSIPDGDGVPGVPLRVDKAMGTEITLTWGTSCAPGDTDFEIYQGEIGDYYSHVKMDPCSTAGATSATFDPPALVGTYYLVAPTNGENEGSYGLRSDETERPQPLHPADRCRPQQIAAVCP